MGDTRLLDVIQKKVYCPVEQKEVDISGNCLDSKGLKFCPYFDGMMKVEGNKKNVICLYEK